MKIMMSGPIRPSVGDVLYVIESIRAQFENTEIFLCTWNGQATDEIRNAVNHCLEVPEPTEQEIDRIVTEQTIQQRQIGAQLKGWTYAIYRMVYGVNMVCNFADPHLKDDDLVLRIRTDTPFLFDKEYLRNLMSSIGQEYIVRDRKSSGVNFDDWFAITRFHILKKTWTFEDYNRSIKCAWNAESLLRNNLTHPFRYLDDTKLTCYICRPNGQRNYHA